MADKVDSNNLRLLGMKVGAPGSSGVARKSKQPTWLTQSAPASAQVEGTDRPNSITNLHSVTSSNTTPIEERSNFTKTFPYTQGQVELKVSLPAPFSNNDYLQIFLKPIKSDDHALRLRVKTLTTNQKYKTTVTCKRDAAAEPNVMAGKENNRKWHDVNFVLGEPANKQASVDVKLDDKVLFSFKIIGQTDEYLTLSIDKPQVSRLSQISSTSSSSDNPSSQPSTVNDTTTPTILALRSSVQPTIQEGEKFTFINGEVRLKISQFGSDHPKSLFRVYFKPSEKRNQLDVTVTKGNEENKTTTVSCRQSKDGEYKSISSPGWTIFFQLGEPVKNQSTFDVKLPNGTSFSFTVLQQSDSNLTLKTDIPESYTVKQIGAARAEDSSTSTGKKAA